MRNFVLKFSVPTLNVLMLFYLFMASITTRAAAETAREHFCVIQADNMVVCWGSNAEHQAIPPVGTFLQVSVGGYHSCAIRTDKTIACWGLNLDGQATPPSGTFLQVSAGYWHSCGVRTNKTLACWGNNNPYWSDKDPYREMKEVKTFGQAEPPSGTFLQVSAGGRHTCGVRTDHTVACCGSHLDEPNKKIGVWDQLELDNSQSIPPSGEFFQVGAGLNYTCGIRTDKSMECWGGFAELKPPTNTFYSQVPGGGRGRCGLKTNGTIVCFNIQDLPGSEGIRVPNSTCRCPYPGRPENDNSCACTSSPDQSFSQILEVGSISNCGVRTDNTVACWGYDEVGQTFSPQGLIVKSADPACLVYGIHNDVKQTQFFIANINAGPLAIYPRSDEGLTDNLQIEALAIDRVNNQLYAASVDGRLYEVRNGAQVVSSTGKLGLNNVTALSFHPDRSLWGWSQDAGLFQVKRDKNNELKLPGTVIVPYNGTMKIQDISWNTEGTIIYGIENFELGNRLWAYDPSQGEAKLICEELMATLKAPINALETHPDNSLIFTFTKQKQLAFGVIDISRCELTTQGEIATEYNQVKGIAWSDCSQPLSVESVSLN